MRGGRRVLLVAHDERWPTEFERIAKLLSEAVGADASRIDHIGSTSIPVAGLPDDPSQWRKELFSEPEGERPMHVHVRMEGRANQRYALLFRDYLRAHGEAAAAYLDVKRGLAALAPDSGAYADAKDPACDLIYQAAERWAADTRWHPSPTD